MNDGRYQYSTRVPSDLARLSDVRRFVEHVTDTLDLDQHRAFDLKVATSEAAANAIEHSGAGGDLITIGAEVSPESVTVEVVSGGDFAVIQRPLDRERNRGMGLPLMAVLTDRLTLSHRREGGMSVGLTVFCHPRT